MNSFSDPAPLNAAALDETLACLEETRDAREAISQRRQSDLGPEFPPA